MAQEKLFLHPFPNKGFKSPGSLGFGKAAQTQRPSSGAADRHKDRKCVIGPEARRQVSLPPLFLKAAFLWELQDFHAAVTRSFQAWASDGSPTVGG